MGPSDDKSPVQTAQDPLGVIKAILGTAAEIKALFGLGIVGLAAAAGRHSHTVRPVVRLYDRLLKEAGPLVGARVKMNGSLPVQLFGNLNHGGSETEYAIDTYYDKQHLRVLLHIWRLPIAPKPCYIIVDHFEELLRRFPKEALDWANSLTNTQGPRFSKLSLEPPSGEGADLDQDLFGKCGCNIGLFKQVLAEIDRNGGGDAVL
ncbi:unnamed protein product [Symbiodinium sp. CCMP2456]|nr:unnamed protein product [Symbiodinium sp. CCMP2456]